MLRWPVTYSHSMQHMCTIFPCNNTLCCGLLTHAQYQDILWVSAISEQITSLILRLLIHSVFFIKRCFWTCLLGGVFFSFCFRPPALVASFKDHFTRGRSIRFLCKLLGIGFSWSCEKNMKSTGCRSWLQWFPGGGEEVITTDKMWSRNNEQWTGRCLQNWRANSCSFNSLHSCFCTLFLCRKKKVIGLLQTTKKICNIPFHLHQVNSPSSGNEKGIKQPPLLLL